jgi:hypothetical protein
MTAGNLAMITSTKHIAAIAAVLVVTAVASPSFAPGSEPHMSAARAAAIHECSVRAQKYAEYTWGNLEMYVYRACMAEHHQAE